jgi:hypothetical protein
LGGTEEVTAMKWSWLIAGLFWVSIAQAQTLRVVSVAVETTEDLPGGIELFCAQDYEAETCKLHVAALARELASYPLDELGEWTFALASSGAWGDLVRSLGGDPMSPAFSVLERRITVLEEAVFAPTPKRRAALLATFRVSGPALLELAVAHELGHAICDEPDERRADAYGRALRDGRPACGTSRRPRRNHPGFASASPSRAARAAAERGGKGE